MSLALEETSELSFLNLVLKFIKTATKLGKACRKLAAARCVIKILDLDRRSRRSITWLRINNMLPTIDRTMTTHCTTERTISTASDSNSITYAAH